MKYVHAPASPGKTAIPQTIRLPDRRLFNPTHLAPSWACWGKPLRRELKNLRHSPAPRPHGKSIKYKTHFLSRGAFLSLLDRANPSAAARHPGRSSPATLRIGALETSRAPMISEDICATKGAKESEVDSLAAEKAVRSSRSVESDRCSGPCRPAASWGPFSRRSCTYCPSMAYISAKLGMPRSQAGTKTPCSAT